MAHIRWNEGLDIDVHFSGKILVHPLFAGFIGKEESASCGEGAEKGGSKTGIQPASI